MLSVYLGKMEEVVYYPPVYFDNRYEDEWITDKRSIEIIRDVDKSDVVSSHLIESPVLGPISPKELSGSVKTIMLMLFDETGRIFNASVCGDNCAKWILKIAESKDLTINLRHIMEFGDGEFEMKILNTGEVVHNMLEFVNVAAKLGVNAARVYQAFTEKSDILNGYIVSEYEVLHTQSREYIVDNLLDVMKEKEVEV